jgi:hypothetical protein
MDSLPLLSRRILSSVSRRLLVAMLGCFTVAAGWSFALAKADAQSGTPGMPNPGLAANPMEEPVRLINEAAQAYAAVQDYTCLFVKREQIQGRLQPDHLITMNVRTRPFEIYLRWLGPANVAGQEVCYVPSKNAGEMRIHATGVRGAFGFVSIKIDDPRVTQSSRHPITEAGIGRLIERYQPRWAAERDLGKTQVRIGEYDYNRRRCIRVECTHPDMSSGQYYAYRTVIYFDKQTHLPIRVESYDAPRPGGPPTLDLLESYSYVDLKLNVGVNEAVFNH